VRSGREIVQFAAKLRICDGNQRFGPLSQRLSVQIRSTVLGNNVVNVGA
jgi:hypothetical protein